MELLYAAHIPDGAGPHPALVLLHGWGASAHDLLGLAPMLYGGRAIALCPQGSVRMDVAPGMPGYGWYDLGQGREADPAEVAGAVAALGRFIDGACERYPIDPARLVLGGFSQGGTLAYQLALREPARFAGLLALSTWLPDELLPQIAPGPTLAKLPILIAHGTEDPAIPVGRARDARELLAGLGVEARYQEFPMGHEIQLDALREIAAWLEEVLGPPPA